MTLCEGIQLAAAVELYWPYIAYCVAVTGAYAGAIWRLDPQSADMRSFNAQLRMLLEKALLRMLFKALFAWMLGGSILLSIGIWVCGVIQ